MPNDTNVAEVYSDRVNLALFYISEQMFASDTPEKTAALYSPNFKGINEQGCTWSSKNSDRSFTECCTVDD